MKEGMKYTPTLLTTTKSVCHICNLTPDRGASGQTLSSPAGEMWRPPGLFGSRWNKWDKLESQF